MFSSKAAIAVLLAGAATLLLAAGQAHAQGRGGCGGAQRGTRQRSGATQMSPLLTSLQQQQYATLAALQQQQLSALLTALQQQQWTASQQQQLNALVLALQQQQQNAALLAALQQLQQQQQNQLRAARNGR